jgi:hypothetical protein
MPDLIDCRIWTADLLRRLADTLWIADDVPGYWRVRRGLEAQEAALKEVNATAG